MAWDRLKMIRGIYGSVKPPGLIEFTLYTVLCAAIILPTYFLFSGRNEHLMQAGAVLFMPVTSWDAAIPLVPWFIWIYCLFYPGFFIVALVTTADRRVMIQGTVGYIATALIALACFGFLPSRMEQPTLEGCLTASCALLRKMYALDDGQHIFPSLHVAYPVCAWLLVRRYLTPWISRPYLVVVIGIAMSTVLLKRHALVDVPAGALTGALGFLVGKWLGPRLAR